MASSILTQNEFPKYLKDHRFKPRHDPTTEEKYPHPWWQVDQVGLQAVLRDISKDITDVMFGTPDGDNELKHLFTQAEALPQVQHGPPIRVALVGAQGAGKSLLINAMFDCDGLSLTGADGAACTSAIIEYVQYPGGRNPNGEQNFLAEIQFQGARKREEMLKEHTRSYRYYEQDIDSDDESDEEATLKMHKKLSRQDEADRRLKDTAEDVFHTLFGGKDKFLEEWNTCDRRNEFVKICQLKCKEAISKVDINSENVATFIGNNAKDLLQQIRPFMTKVKGQVCLWPLVDHISIRFHSPLLEQGLVLVDLPGWGDINLSRNRHADEIKDTVDVEFIVADTIRIATDDAVINNARSAVLNHGAAKVKLIATKIDSISKNQLSQCSGPRYDYIRNRLKLAEDAAIQAEEEDDTGKADELNKYKVYLERKLKERKIQDRAMDISQELATKLDGRQPEDKVQCIHVSASEYMQWVVREKIIFRDQPALAPDQTGIPAIRQFLYSLPVSQNFEDTRKHVYSTVPAFLEKIKRVTNESDRDAGFSDIADNFSEFCKEMFSGFVAESKEILAGATSASIEIAYSDPDTYKTVVDDMIQKSWMVLKGPTFNKILKGRGTVLPGTSRARGLELGCDWNKELSNALAPIFRKWYSQQTARTDKLRVALKCNMDGLFTYIRNLISKTPANLGTIEKSLRRWNPHRFKLFTKAEMLMDSVNAKLELLLHRATMDDGRQNSLLSLVTDSLFDDVFSSAPALKDGSTDKKKKYVSPKLKFQKSRMYKIFLHPDNHVVDVTIKIFQDMVIEAMNQIVVEHTNGISELLQQFSTALRSQAPVSYTITPVGKKIRSDLKEILPKLQEKADSLRKFMPLNIGNEDTELPVAEFSESTPSMHNIAYYLDSMQSKRKKEAGTKIKQEPGSKKRRFQ